MFLPVNLNIEGGWCVLIGGGESATRKARLLAKAGARLCVLFCHSDLRASNPELADLVDTSNGKIVSWADGEKSVLEHLESLIPDAQLCIIACDGIGSASQTQLSALCVRNSLPVNVVDKPKLCTFTFPAMVERGSLSVAISTDGKAPVLARQLRARIEALLPSQYGALVELAGQYRDRVKNQISDAVLRRRFWENALNGPAAEQVFSGNSSAAKRIMDADLEAEGVVKTGEVYLVGAGPGDPELLTLRALRLMQQADVVFYDRLVADDIMELVRRDAERIYVGKERANHSTPQAQINELLLHYAQKGKRVLRLKGGDPFIFGRGGEEIEHLAANGVSFQVVPGITAASACASYAGIPLTHRDHAQSVRFITGHLKQGQLDLSWLDLLDTQQTLVFYMGLNAAATISEQLIAHGRATDTPTAIVESGSTAAQRVVVATLNTFPKRLKENDIQSPAVIIIGTVVQLHEKLAWFKTGDKVE
ncbi:MAG: siroheme synthase CysG [Pseudomonadales bacterium]